MTNLWRRTLRSLWHYRGYRRARRNKYPSGYVMVTAEPEMVEEYMRGHASGVEALRRNKPDLD